MVGIKELDKLLKAMDPILIGKTFVFCTVSKKVYEKLGLDAVLSFKEAEGITLVLEKDFADKNNLSYEGIWSLITLNVHSDLSAVGFLAKISEKLAAAGISVNVVSAYYHDHLFVPADKTDKAMSVLKSLSK